METEWEVGFGAKTGDAGWEVVFGQRRTVVFVLFCFFLQRSYRNLKKKKKKFKMEAGLEIGRMEIFL